jgi:DNA mismatch repair protein MutL
MARIKLLPEQLVNKIAAGEVVERPASVVKELIENAIDAGAKDISVEVRKGGKAFIRVRDDGCGMDRDDLLLSLQRHSTSKIETADDLFKIETLGFRGEALPSIAAVSKMEITSKPSGAFAGRRVKITGGKIEEDVEAGAPEGTEITVSELLFNTPARQKFLRAIRAETSYVIAEVTRQALAHYTVGFTLVVDGDEVFRVAVAKEPLERITALFDANAAKQLMPVEAEKEGVRMRGFVSRLDLTRSTKKDQCFFVNKRPVECKALTFAIADVYSGMLPPRRFPVVFLYLEINPALVDVNVHPTKRVVKFQNEFFIRDIVREAVIDVLGKADLSQMLGFGDGVEAVREVPSAYVTRMELGVIERLPAAQPGGETGTETEPAAETKAGGETGTETSACLFPAEKSSLRPVGQIQYLYVICETPEGMAIVDQHAAHEKVLFERIMQIYKEKAGEVQTLLTPVVVQLPANEFVVARDYIPIFKLLGFRVEQFGKNALKIDGVPACFRTIDAERVIRDVIADVFEGGKSMTVIEREMAERVAKKACRAAVKQRDILNREEIDRLLEDLLKCENPYTCPHGRPTIIKISKEELERRFGRS